MARAPGKGRRAAGGRERGVALLVVIISLALLTAVATDFAYNARVDLQIASNQRDEVQAYYLARSGVGMGRLLLRFQKQLDASMGALTQGLPQLPGMPSIGNIQLYKMARVDCHMLRGMVTSTPGEEQAAEPEASDFGIEAQEAEETAALTTALPRKSFGGFEGCFLATITDEEEKINLQLLGDGSTSQTKAAIAVRLLELMNDKRFAFLFEEEDANRVKAVPQDVLLALNDWTDADEVESTLTLQNPTNPMPAGFSDEGRHYDRFDPRYRPKNARFDTLDEIYRVHGVNDRFMTAFRDLFTVYPSTSAKTNINTDNPLLMMAAIFAAVPQNSPSAAKLQNPVFMQEIITQIRLKRMYSFLGMTVKDFVALLEAAGLQVSPEVKNPTAPANPLSDKSNTFRISSVGEAGDVQKRITAVVQLDDGLGKLVYWREE